LASSSDKFAWIIKCLEAKFDYLEKPFLKKLDERTAQQEYDPRLVDNEPKRDSLLMD
jgi:hypothetical protein